MLLGARNECLVLEEDEVQPHFRNSPKQARILSVLSRTTPRDQLSSFNVEFCVGSNIFKTAYISFHNKPD